MTRYWTEHSDLGWEDTDPPDENDGDEEYDESEECGRWLNGRLSPQCANAGTEWCDWVCPIGLPTRKTRARKPKRDLFDAARERQRDDREDGR